MNMAITFNTLAFAKKLKAAGVPPDQAEAQAEVFSEVLGESASTVLATKNDIGDVKTEINNLKVEMYKIVGLQTVALLTAFIAITKLLH